MNSTNTEKRNRPDDKEFAIKVIFFSEANTLLIFLLINENKISEQSILRKHFPVFVSTRKGLTQLFLQCLH